jgi:hypothetical protein
MFMATARRENTPSEPIRQHARLARETAEPASIYNSFVKHFDFIRATLIEAQKQKVTAVVFGIRGDSAYARLMTVSRRAPISTMVVGRDSHADLRFNSDFTMHQRHVMVRLARTRRRGMTLRIFSLTNEATFCLENGKRACDVVSEGDVFVRVGESAVLAFVVDGELLKGWNDVSALDVWRSLPPRLVKSDGTHQRVVEEENGTEIVRSRKQIEEAKLQAANDLPYREPTIEFRLPSEKTLRRGRVSGVVISVRTERGTIACNFANDRLSQPITLGRDANCDVTIDDEACEAISRVHAVLVREGSGFWLHDAASKEGVTVEGESARCAYVRDGTAVVLAGIAIVTFAMKHHG